MGEGKETVPETRIEIVNIGKSCLDRDEIDSHTAKGSINSIELAFCVSRRERDGLKAPPLWSA